MFPFACIVRHTHAYAHVSFGLIDSRAWYVTVASCYSYLIINLKNNSLLSCNFVTAGNYLMR
jgi:hypothetical protein